MTSWPPRLLCLTRQDRPAALPAATSSVTRRCQVPSALGRTSPRWVPSCSCSPRIHIAHTGFGRNPETWHASSKRPGPGLEAADSQASGFTASSRERGILEGGRALEAPASAQARGSHSSACGDEASYNLRPSPWLLQESLPATASCKCPALHSRATRAQLYRRRMFQALLELFICLLPLPLKQRSCLTLGVYVIKFTEPQGCSVNVCGMNKWPHALSIPSQASLFLWYSKGGEPWPGQTWTEPRDAGQRVREAHLASPGLPFLLRGGL